jgi:PAS domain S-box-containing protein
MLQIQEQVSHSKLVTDTPHILLVDSDPQMRQYMTGLLSEHYAIDAVADAPSAFTLTREQVPDLVLASVMTCVLDGFDLLREFRRDARVGEVPIILYSSSTGEESCLEGIEAGADDYMITPLSERQLLTRVRAQLRIAQTCRQSIHALRASEERYRTLVTATTANVWSAAPNGDVIGEAQGWEKMTGQTPQEYRGSSWIDVVHSDDRQRLLETWRRAVRGATPFTADYRIRRSDGSYRYVRAQGAPVHNSDGSVREWIGTHVDIDEQVRAEEALRTSEAEFRANFELAGIGQAQVDPETGQILRVNRRFCEMLGYSADELLTLRFLDIRSTFRNRPNRRSLP